MVSKITVRAIYEDGVFKPTKPLILNDKQEVELHVEVIEQPKKNVKLGGILAPYWDGDAPTAEEIDKILAEEKTKSFERLMRQINGDFSEDDSATE